MAIENLEDLRAQLESGERPALLDAYRFGARTERGIIASWLRWKHPELDEIADLIESNEFRADSDPANDDHGG